LVCFGQIVDDLNDLSDIIGALVTRAPMISPESNGGVDPVQAVRGLFHGGNALCKNFLAANGCEISSRNLCRIRHALNRSPPFDRSC